MRLITTALIATALFSATPIASAQKFSPEGSDSDRMASAIESGSVAAVRRLLDNGISANTLVYEAPALQQAVWDEKYYVAKLLIDRGADVNVADDTGYTLLMIACDMGNYKIAKLLIDKGANVNAVEKEYGISVLQSACAGGDENLVDLLLEQGADLNHVDKYKGNCLEEAAFAGSKSIVDKLAAKGLKTKWPLHVACGLGDLEQVKKLLAGGAEVNQENDGWKNTPIQFAAGGGHVEVAKLLLEKGAELDTKNLDGGTLLHIAATTPERLDFVKWLVEQKVDINAQDNDGMTPLDWSEGQTYDYLEKQGAQNGDLLLLEDHLEE